MKLLFNALKWVLHEAWEKINLPAVYRELVELGKKHGRRFFWAALIWELIEDVVFPLLSWWAGVPELIPLFLVLHFEPIAYPVIFWLFRMYDRSRGIVPEFTDRGASSSSWRSVAKVAIYKIAITGWFAVILLGLNISLLALVAYVVMMGFFGFIHERIWNDLDYGISGNDIVSFKRTWAKATTYRVVSTMTMYPLLKALLGYTPWLALIGCQVVGYVLYLTLEALWSRNEWGINQQTKEEENGSTEENVRHGSSLQGCGDSGECTRSEEPAGYGEQCDRRHGECGFDHRGDPAGYAPEGAE